MLDVLIQHLEHPHHLLLVNLFHDETLIRAEVHESPRGTAGEICHLKTLHRLVQLRVLAFAAANINTEQLPQSPKLLRLVSFETELLEVLNSFIVSTSPASLLRVGQLLFRALHMLRSPHMRSSESLLDLLRKLSRPSILPAFLLPPLCIR